MKKRSELLLIIIFLGFTGFSAWSSHSAKVTPSRLPFLADVSNIDILAVSNWQKSGLPDRTLAMGDKAAGVSLIQSALKTDPKLYPNGRVDGFFDNVTREAILQFQKQYGLKPTGVADDETLGLFNELYYSELCPLPTKVYPDLSVKNVSKIVSLPEDYVPSGLVRVNDYLRANGTQCIRKDVLPYLVKMFEDARADGVEFNVVSAYRQTEIQELLFDSMFKSLGKNVGERIAHPAHSEHQLGTTVDLSGKSLGFGGVDSRIAITAEGKWLRLNAHKYGFIMSYPFGKEEVTGYMYEPWHWRFVGVDIASEIYNSQVLLPDFLDNLSLRGFPILRDEIKELNLSAESALSFFINVPGGLPAQAKSMVLVAKNEDGQIPLADPSLLAIVAVHENKDSFVSDVNRSAKTIGMHGTLLKPEKEGSYSTASDIQKLILYLFKTEPGLFEIKGKSEYSFTGTSAGYRRRALAGDISSSIKLLGTKAEGGAGSLITINPAPGNKGYIINIILSSPNASADMKTLSSYISSSYKW